MTSKSPDINTSFEQVVADPDYLVRELARQRKKVDSATRTLAQIETLVHRQFPELAEAKIKVKVEQDQEKVLADQLRLDALEMFERGDGGKSEIHPAIQIKEYTVLEYDEKSALDYCRQHLPKALKLVKKPFEAVAKVAELDFVTIRKEPRATIKRDLSEYVDEC